jgi:hypothetical protein
MGVRGLRNMAPCAATGRERALARLTGITRLSKPPQEAPMPNRRSASMARSMSASAMPAANSSVSRPLAPEHSRRQTACAGSSGKAGHSTRATSALPCSHWATRKALRACCAMRSGSERMPRSTRKASSAPTVWPKSMLARSSARQARALVTTAPIITSAWPPRYLVAARIEISAPSASGRHSNPDAQVLSTASQQSWRRANSASCRRSGIS